MYVFPLSPVDIKTTKNPSPWWGRLLTVPIATLPNSVRPDCACLQAQAICHVPTSSEAATIISWSARDLQTMCAIRKWTWKKAWLPLWQTAGTAPPGDCLRLLG